jgi:hypothetical protein
MNKDKESLTEAVLEKSRLDKLYTDLTKDSKKKIKHLERKLYIFENKPKRTMEVQTDWGGKALAQSIGRYDYSTSEQDDSYDQETEGVKKIYVEMAR